MKLDYGAVALEVDHGKVQTLWFHDGVVRLQHECPRGEGLIVVCAPMLQLRPGGHTVVSRPPNPVTVTPSCGCEQCGLHGFLENGKWRDC